MRCSALIVLVVLASPGFGQVLGQADQRFAGAPGDSIGFSFSDYLTNGSAMRHLVNFGDGQFAFVRSALSDTSAGTSGNYFKFYDGFAWSTEWEPISTTRSGRGTLDQIRDAGGVVTVVGHPLTLFVHAPPPSGWSESEIFCTENFWPRIAIGSGLDIHLIGTEGPTHIGYHRSTDVGSTWSCDRYLVTHTAARVDADAYDLTAKGESVAFAVAGAGGDVVVLESTDRGITWSETVIYDIDETGNTPGHEPPDGSCSVIYDADTRLHVAWGSYLYNEDGLMVESVDAGIRHWSATTGVQEIAWPYPDTTIHNPGGRDGNLATGPDLCAADDGSLFMLFSRFIAEKDANGNNYEHVFGIGSMYAGMDWQTDQVTDMTPGAGFDAAFPSAADLVDDYLYFTYASDPYAGNWIRGNHPQVAVDYMFHMVEAASFFPVGSVGDRQELPGGALLRQNFPNPFNGITNFQIGVFVAAEVTLVIYDLLGQEVATLVNERLRPGSYERRWDAGDLPSGVYLYRLTVVPEMGGAERIFVETRKLILLR